MRKKETPEQSSAIFEQMYEKYVRGFPSLYLFHKIKPAPLELSEQLVEILYADFFVVQLHDILQCDQVILHQQAS